MGQPNEFPKYPMKIDGKRIFLSLREASVAYNSGSVHVEFGRYVLNEDFNVRHMTAEDRSKIGNAAEKYDASK